MQRHATALRAVRTRQLSANGVLVRVNADRVNVGLPAACMLLALVLAVVLSLPGACLPRLQTMQHGCMFVYNLTHGLSGCQPGPSWEQQAGRGPPAVLSSSALPSTDTRAGLGTWPCSGCPALFLDSSRMVLGVHLCFVCRQGATSCACNVGCALGGHVSVMHIHGRGERGGRMPWYLNQEQPRRDTDGAAAGGLCVSPLGGVRSTRWCGMFDWTGL